MPVAKAGERRSESRSERRNDRRNVRRMRQHSSLFCFLSPRTCTVRRVNRSKWAYQSDGVCVSARICANQCACSAQNALLALHTFKLHTALCAPQPDANLVYLEKCVRLTIARTNLENSHSIFSLLRSICARSGRIGKQNSQASVESGAGLRLVSRGAPV